MDVGQPHRRPDDTDGRGRTNARRRLLTGLPAQRAADRSLCRGPDRGFGSGAADRKPARMPEWSGRAMAYGHSGIQTIATHYTDTAECSRGFSRIDGETSSAKASIS